MVTFVFTDIEGSTRLARALGEGYRRVLAEHRRVLRSFLCVHGAELLTEGDSFFVAFDDAAAAVRACVDAQRALAGHGWPDPDLRPRVRMGLHTGYAECHDGEYASLEVHRAARVAAAAHGDQVLCSETTVAAADLVAADLVAADLVAADLTATTGAPRDAAPAPRARPGAGVQDSVANGTDEFRDDRAGDTDEFRDERANGTDDFHGDRAGGTVGRGPVRALDLGRHLLRGFDDRIRVYQVLAEGLPHAFPRPRTVDGRRHNLPAPLTRLVGRDDELAELELLLRGQRLVTVWGTGGVGKTRLALEVAHAASDRYLDGVWFADLAAVEPDPAPDCADPVHGNAHAPDPAPDSADPVDGEAYAPGPVDGNAHAPGPVAGETDANGPVDRLAVHLAREIGAKPGPGQPAVRALVEYLVGQDCLLVLDTCERPRSAVAALVARLLAACPELTVLATSRVPLRVPGELVWRLRPLDVTAGRADGYDRRRRHLAPAPEPYSVSAEPYTGRTEPAGVAPRGAGAVALLLDRSDGPVPADRVPELDRVARQLDGLPLALELAAPLLRAVPPALLAERLATAPAGMPATGAGRAVVPLDGPAPARHASLRASLEWSYGLLGPPAARLLRWLSVCPGGVDLVEVEWLTACWLDPAEAYAAVVELVDGALLEADLAGSTATYRMPYPVRIEARRLAAEAGELTAARGRYQALHHRAAARPATPQLVRQPVAANR